MLFRYVTLIDLADDFAADLAPSRFAVRHESGTRTDDSSGKAASNRFQIADRLVYTKTGFANACDVVDKGLALRVVAQLHLDDWELPFGRDLVAGDITLGFQDLDDFYFDCAVRNVDGRMVRLAAVTNTRQKVRDWIAMHVIEPPTFLPARLLHAGQFALVRFFPQTNAADAEESIVAAVASAERAAIV